MTIDMKAVEQYSYTYTVTGRCTFKTVNERLMWKIKVTTINSYFCCRWC